MADYGLALYGDAIMASPSFAEEKPDAVRAFLRARPLLPLYISSVDSGNLAGHLLTHGAGLRELADEGILAPQVFAGLRDTVEVLWSLAAGDPALAELDADLSRAPGTLAEVSALLERATGQAAGIAASLAKEGEELRRWGGILEENCRQHRNDLHFMAPWLELGGSPGAGCAAASAARAELGKKLARLDQVPTLREVAILARSAGPLIGEALKELEMGPERAWLAELSRCMLEAEERARERMLVLEELAREGDAMAEMDFKFLSDPERNCFPSGTTSPNAGWIPVSTTCWPRRRAWPLCRHRPGPGAAGSLVLAGPAAGPFAAGAAWFPGAARCSNT